MFSSNDCCRSSHSTRLPQISHTALCTLTRYTDLGWTLPVPVPLCPWLPVWGSPITSQCHPALSQLPPLPNTPAAPSIAGTPHHLASFLQIYNCQSRQTFPQFSKLIDPYCHLCKKCRYFDKERAVLECLPEPPHHSWTLSGVSVRIQLGGPAYLLLSIWGLKHFCFQVLHRKLVYCTCLTGRHCLGSIESESQDMNKALGIRPFLLPASELPALTNCSHHCCSSERGYCTKWMICSASSMPCTVLCTPRTHMATALTAISAYKSGKVVGLSY